MAKSILLGGSLLGLLLLIGLSGCTNPESHPIVPPPPIKDGVDLDLTLNTIGPDPSGKPYLVHEDWVIDSGRTVTILPGTEIMFHGLVWVDVAGQMIAHGSVESPIIFTTAYLEERMGQWRGFKLHNGTDVSEFEHCVFSYGAFYDTDTMNVDAVTYRGMLAINNSSPVIERCVVIYNQNNAVYMTGERCAPRVRYNIFTVNDASAVRCDTTVLLPDVFEQPGRPDVSFNCVAENSAISFIMGFDSTRYGVKFTKNTNLDSCDMFYNIDLPPLMMDPLARNFALQSCSPCVDAGPAGVDPDPDGTRADMGTVHYVQVAGELRGVIDGTLQASVPYRMSCHVRVDSGKTLTIPAGTQIEVVGLYNLEVHGRLIVEGTSGGRVRISSGNGGDLWGGLRFLGYDVLAEPSQIRNMDLVNYQSADVWRPGVQFDGCRFEAGFRYGVACSTGTVDLADSVGFHDCTFLSCGEYAVLVDSSAAVIRNTLVEDTRGRGLSLRNTGTSVLISNCIVRGSRTSGLVAEYFASPTVTNCVFMDNLYHGAQFVNNCRPVLLNNIIYRNAKFGVFDSLSSFPVMDYNNVFGHWIVSGADTTHLDYHGPNSSGGEHSLSVNPSFVDEAADLHLNAGSPCVNAGDPRPEFNDADGSRNDMGAYGGPGGDRVGASPLRRARQPLASK